MKRGAAFVQLLRSHVLHNRTGSRACFVGGQHTIRWIVLAACLTTSQPREALAANLAENTVKRSLVASSNANTVIAAYLVNFLRYVEWPEAVPPAGEPWRIGLLNGDDLHSTLERLAQGKTVRGRPIAIADSSDPAALHDCQIVLLADILPANEATVAKIFADRPVLTVVYHEKRLISAGVMIELVLEGRNIRYRLNPALLTSAGLKPTPGLLENALPPTPASVALAQSP